MSLSNIEEIKIPDIGDFDSVEVIEIAVSVGDSVETEDTLITVESDKASMDIPSPKVGEIKEIKVNIGDKVSEGTPIISLLISEEGVKKDNQVSKETEEVEEKETPKIEKSENIPKSIKTGRRHAADALNPPAASAARIHSHFEGHVVLIY